MWEYIGPNKKIRPGRPNPESSDIHQASGVSSKSDADAIDGSEHSELADETQRQRQAPRRRFRPTRKLTCPACDSPMEIEQIGRVEVDRCTNCGGIFLDPGELRELTGTGLSSYHPAQQSDEQDRDFIIYTPHGLSDHVVDRDHDHED